VSHGKKHKKRRKARVQPVCAVCSAPQDGSPEALLTRVAGALNACTDAGVRVKLRHGIVVAREGYVFPLIGGVWMARTLAGVPLSAAGGELDDTDDD
jgi:hypothetical protein